MSVAPSTPRLAESLTCDSVIVGSGIAGLSVAYELARLGRSVVVLYRGPIAGGMSARTTAHLAPICDDGLGELISKRGEQTARLFQESQEAAVARIEEIAGHHGIACGFRRLDAFLFPAFGMDRAEAGDQIDQEIEAARKIGAAAERHRGVPLRGYEDAPVLRYPDQATFHPLKYLKGLVAACRTMGVRLFRDTAVTAIDETGEVVRVTTETGLRVTATDVVVATNSPIGESTALHAKMAPYRTYAMAFTLPRNALPDALYWDMGDPYHYVRMQPGPGKVDYLIAGGADHRTGEADDGGVRFEAIEAWIRQLVPRLSREVHRWSGQVLDTPDYCGFIGRSPDRERIYIATGDSGQGITHGVVAGLLLRDLITSGGSPWLPVYDPARPIGSGLVNAFRENLTTLTNLTGSAQPAEAYTTADLAPGQGRVMQKGRRKVAICRDLEGHLHVLSATCSHSGCVVAWNGTEQCWECPCHGSHFAPDGTVLNGPATVPLEQAA